MRGRAPAIPAESLTPDSANTESLLWRNRAGSWKPLVTTNPSITHFLVLLKGTVFSPSRYSSACKARLPGSGSLGRTKLTSQVSPREAHPASCPWDRQHVSPVLGAVISSKATTEGSDSRPETLNPCTEPRDSLRAGTGRRGNPRGPQRGAWGSGHSNICSGSWLLLGVETPRALMWAEKSQPRGLHVSRGGILLRRGPCRTPRSDQGHSRDSGEAGRLSGQHAGTRVRSPNCTELVSLRAVSQVWHLPPCRLPSEMKALWPDRWHGVPARPCYRRVSHQHSQFPTDIPLTAEEGQQLWSWGPLSEPSVRLFHKLSGSVSVEKCFT